MNKTTLQLQKGDHILWPEHDHGKGIISRHESGTVVKIVYDKVNDGVVAKVFCTRDCFCSGINAIHNIDKQY